MPAPRHRTAALMLKANVLDLRNRQDSDLGAFYKLYHGNVARTTPSGNPL